MKKYTIITYRLNKSVNPDAVLQAIEEILQNRDVCYQNCLFKMVVSIIEYEHESVLHSNRKKNAILSICKKYPTFEPFFEHLKVDKGEGHTDEDLCLNNFSDIDYSQKGKIEYSILRNVVTKIPRPYAVNSLEVVFDGICFKKENGNDSIRMSEDGFGHPVGNYISYERSSYGSEKHSYVTFSAEKTIADDMRKLFFDFTEKVPGKYDGTEIKLDTGFLEGNK